MAQRDRDAIKWVWQVAIAVALGVSPAHAGWEQGTVQVHATTARVPQVAACADGAGGAIVVWQEETNAGLGVLRASHVRADASMDSEWGDGVVLASSAVTRSRVSAVADDRGGAYVWWLEGSNILITHIAATGGVSAGWPASGRELGVLIQPSALPQVFADGTGGVYVGWLGGLGLLTGSQKLLLHLGPDGLRTGDWRGTTLPILELAAPEGFPFGVSFAPAADGGVWLAWARVEIDSSGLPKDQGEYRATHILRDGTPARGWGLAGRPLGEWSVAPRSWFNVVGQRMRPIAIADAGDGGCLVLRFDFSADLPTLEIGAGVHWYASNGKLRVDWSAGGLGVGVTYLSIGTPEDSPQLVATSDGGIVVGSGYYGTEDVRGFGFQASPPDGQSTRFGRFEGNGLGMRLLPDGSVLVTDLLRTAWDGYRSPFEAHLSGILIGSDGREARFSEFHPEFGSGTWYGGAAITSLGPESALLVWSQEQGRHGVFVNRLTLGQPVLDAGPPATQLLTRHLLAAFAHGEGVRVRATFITAGASRVQLFDLAGRQVADARASEARALDLVVPGSADLAAGLYFARAVHGAESQVARVVIAR